MINWECQLLAVPSTNFSLLFNEMIEVLPSQPDVKCGREPQVIFFVQEVAQHVCYSHYDFTVLICFANESVVGDFSIISSSGGVVAGTNITVTLIEKPGNILTTHHHTTVSFIHTWYPVDVTARLNYYNLIIKLLSFSSTLYIYLVVISDAKYRHDSINSST